MDNPIYPCLWFDGNAREAAEYYCTVFPESEIFGANPYVTIFQNAGQKFMCLNGGPHFSFNASISFFVLYESEEKLEKAWSILSLDGKVMMPLESYEWCPKYGWLQDRFGVNWQLYFGKMEEVGQKFTPAFMFSGLQNGNAEKAVRFYTSVFEGSGINGILHYANGENEVEGNVKHAQFNLGKHVFMAMDSSLQHQDSFNEAISMVVECETQKEIDYYWNILTEGGSEGRCGWLKDKFGVSWQIVPKILGSLMNDPSKSQKVIDAFMQMKKFEIEKLVNA
jgi:predicted 3-demethylubiquinone-9 3-methyltransferase (glyoxalase superfamily)